MLSIIKQWVTAQIQGLRGRGLVLVADTTMIPIAWLLAYWFRYNFEPIPRVFFQEALALLPYVVAIHFVTFLLFGVHRGVWRFTSIPDLMRVVKAVIFSTALIAVVIFFITRLAYVPRSVVVMHGMLLVALLAGPRLLYRLAKDRHIATSDETKVLVVGAGSAGELLVRDLLRAVPRQYEPVAFVDDDKSKRNKDIHGIPVLGECATIPTLCEKMGIELVMIALPSATAEQMQRAVEWCERAKVPFRTLPKLHDIMSGAASHSELRKVEIDDLLGRQPVNLNWESICAGLADKCILVTGAGGSIGSELCRQLVRVNAKQLILFERSEFNLYAIDWELGREHPQLDRIALLGDVCDESSVKHLFQTHKPDAVFHAAAYKHVPLLQEQARETVKNNILGTRNVASAAHDSGCQVFVQISTDKAVNPTSMMGASKRVAEIYCQALSENSDTTFVTVRFGNVLGSAGSVVPLFRKQIEAGGPVTVTHPEMTRYFMTLSEACQLILQASLIGKASEIYVLNMGEPVNISYLARQMIRLSGLVPGEDIEIEYTGLRAGEKLAEELFHPDEKLFETDYEKILLAQCRKVTFEKVNAACGALNIACSNFDYGVIESTVAGLVPEYQPVFNEEMAPVDLDKVAHA